MGRYARRSLAAFICAISLHWISGCVIVRPYTPYYSPPYYDGYIVYFDTAGKPFYYLHGRPVYVPRKYSGYNGLVAHYRSHRAPYERWNREHGARYHAYRNSGPKPDQPRLGQRPPPKTGNPRLAKKSDNKMRKRPDKERPANVKKKPASNRKTPDKFRKKPENKKKPDKKKPDCKKNEDCKKIGRR